MPCTRIFSSRTSVGANASPYLLLNTLITLILSFITFFITLTFFTSLYTRIWAQVLFIHRHYYIFVHIHQYSPHKDVCPTIRFSRSLFNAPVYHASTTSPRGMISNIFSPFVLYKSGMSLSAFLELLVKIHILSMSDHRAWLDGRAFGPSSVDIFH